MLRYQPKRVFIEPDALEYPLGIKLQALFTDADIPIETTTAHNRVTGIPGKSDKEKYIQAKRSLVIGVRRSLTFQSCKPSAHYQLPLVTSCPGLCEYCYLQTTLGPKPAVRIYVNTDQILAKASEYMRAKEPDITIFEGAATSDPIPVEYLTGALKQAIEFFGQTPLGRFRFVTKFADVDSLLTAAHQEHTEIRFSLNTDTVIDTYEKGTSSAKARLEAAEKVAKAGYPIGFLLAPILIYENWQVEYTQLITALARRLPKDIHVGFELITHRYTTRAKNNILKVFPDTTLPMDESERQFKYGQFGYGKYVYPKETMAAIKEFFHQELNTHFPYASIAYLV